MVTEAQNVSALFPRLDSGDRRNVGGETYVAPRLVRVRVATGRMTLGFLDANTYCTIHVHDDQYHPNGKCDFN